MVRGATNICVTYSNIDCRCNADKYSTTQLHSDNGLWCLLLFLHTHSLNTPNILCSCVRYSFARMENSTLFDTFHRSREKICYVDEARQATSIFMTMSSMRCFIAINRNLFANNNTCKCLKQNI